MKPTLTQVFHRLNVKAELMSNPTQATIIEALEIKRKAERAKQRVFSKIINNLNK